MQEQAAEPRVVQVDTRRYLQRVQVPFAQCVPGNLRNTYTAVEGDAGLDAGSATIAGAYDFELSGRGVTFFGQQVGEGINTVDRISRRIFHDLGFHSVPCRAASTS